MMTRSQQIANWTPARFEPLRSGQIASQDAKQMTHLPREVRIATAARQPIPTHPTESSDTENAIWVDFESGGNNA